MKIIIKNATIVNFDSLFKGDILIHNNHILRIGKIEDEKVDKKIDATGKYILPGFIDMHTHLRTPGREDKENLLTANLRAAKGGFTTICCMPNTTPPIDNEGLAAWIRRESQKIGMVNIYPIGAVTKKREGKELTEFAALQKAGCLSLSDDGDPIRDSSVLRKALEYAQMFNLLNISHCEDRSLSAQGVLRESLVSSRYGLEGIPYISEAIDVFRVIEIARYLDTRVHLAHISTKRSIEIIRQAKKEGVKVSCETAPHYFILSVEDIERREFDANLKVNPPLGEKEDIEEIKQALKEGVIDCIATDHAPHSFGEKELPFEEAPFGFIGLEFAFSLCYTYLVKEGVIDLKDLVSKISVNPAKILGLDNVGYIKEGAFADLVIVDLNKRWRLKEDELIPLAKNTPFIGYQLQGKVEYTIHKGKVVYPFKNEFLNYAV